MSEQNWQLMGDGAGITLGIVKAATPEEAVKAWRKEKGQEDAYFDAFYHIKKVMQGFRVIVGT